MKNISVFQDENANYCVIVGTDDRVEAEAALRKQEDEWFGPLAQRDPDNELEKPMNMDDFVAGDIYHGTYKGEECHYWGDDPAAYFDGGKYTTEPGFIAPLY
jgi:hypothetical protein